MVTKICRKCKAKYAYICAVCNKSQFRILINEVTKKFRFPFSVEIFLEQFEKEFIFNTQYEKYLDLYNYKNLKQTYLRIGKKEKLSKLRLVIHDITKIFLKKYLYENSLIQILARKHRQLIFRNEYGDLIFDDYFKELKKFSTSKIYHIKYYIDSQTPTYFVKFCNYYDKSLKRFLSYEYDENYTLSPSELLADDLQPIVSEYIENDFHEPINITTTDPYEYERLVAAKLESIGFSCQVTKGSGDQGADIIANKDDLTYVVQCKLHSQAVSNKAVQEVSSARDYYNAHMAIVISNQNFTKSARQLANVQKVFLIHDSDIEYMLGENYEESEIS